MNLPIYLDHAATTPVAPEVLEAMLPYFTEAYGNPATLYSVGQAAKAGVDAAREIVAETLNATPGEIVFTSGGTESDNMAIRGVAERHRVEGGHLLTTAIEHHAVLEPMETLAHQGFAVEFAPVNSEGIVEVEEIARRLRSNTRLVSVMHANNEIGTIQPISEIGALCREHGILFHVDAVQTFGKLPLDVRAMQIDMLSLSAHKLYGPKGIGAFYVRRGVRLARYQEGGSQESKRRGGTLNVPGIVGLGRATEIARSLHASEAQRLSALQQQFFARLPEAVPGARITGSLSQRLPGHIHFCVPGVEGEPMLLALDAAGICAAAGSACTTGAVAPSHVLRAIGLSDDLARGALRLTMGRATTEEALNYVLKKLTETVADLRGLAGKGAPVAV